MGVGIVRIKVRVDRGRGLFECHRLFLKVGLGWSKILKSGTGDLKISPNSPPVLLNGIAMKMDAEFLISEYDL